ncbi:DUF5331 domain-containing protein [Crocosphaera chwakensis]|uniref:Uncharacterized protein n=1 Tax=Crocosphaera chwakensis CCY0110 TaxID=391612 RepID=A3IV67_9CHRO|nr:DUF5331 domain-containing protein [Crocosphaera chwakensis]EAZ89628.1 hypothetical protein CY0110_24386 [Crocosphaera chwakensis CCY0110]
MSEFEKLKVTLNDKWLDYYEGNRSWLKKELPTNSNGYMDSSILAYIILGVIAAIEPKVKEFLEPFSELNQDPQDLLRVLEVDYLDLDRKLKERSEKRAKNPQLNSSDTDEIERIRQQLSKGEL